MRHFHLQPQNPPSTFLDRNRFVILFFTLLFFILTVPIINHLEGILLRALPPLLEGLAFVVVLIEALVSVSTRRAHRFIGLSLGLPAVLMGAMPALFDSLGVELLRHLFAVAFLSYVIGLLVIFIFNRQRVTFNTVCASLCIYLLLGLVFALAYSVVDLLISDSFRLTVANSVSPPFTRFGKGSSTPVLYFSFTTLTTLGYGDIVPTSPIARALTSIEAITGQVYLAVLVARLVGLNIAESIEQKNKA
jgi:hypothetical protein